MGLTRPVYAFSLIHFEDIRRLHLTNPSVRFALAVILMLRGDSSLGPMLGLPLGFCPVNMGKGMPMMEVFMF